MTQGSENQTNSKEPSNLLKKEDVYYQKLAELYDLDLCVEWILKNNFEKVCLQFPDSLLIDSVDIGAYIENKISRKIYILGDTTFGSMSNQLVFKEPQVPVKKVKKNKKVLDEDAYLEKMGKIIERDFFPDLRKLVAQNDYLDAVEKNDTVRLREIYAKYSNGARPPTEGYNSPATFETPSDSHKGDPVEDQARSTRSNLDEESESICSEQTSKTLSLNKYLANYTSEDNQSFEEVMEESEVRKRQKQPWLYKDEKTNIEALEGGLNVPAIEQQFSVENKRPLEIETWGYKNKNYIMYVPDGEKPTEDSKGEIVHCNTRFTTCPFDETQSKERIQGLAQQQVKILDGKIGVDGKEVVGGTPNIGGFSFVRTPSPAPGVTESPLMTWGEIEGTPFRLDRTPGPSFRIPEPPRRERLAHALADKHASDRKKRTATPLLTPKQGVDRLQSMSPAARRLASTQLRKAFGTTDKALLASYSPRVSPRTPSTPNLRQTPTRTPSICSDKHADIAITTDNLLNINLPSRSSDLPSKSKPSSKEPPLPAKIKVTDLLSKSMSSNRPKASDFFL